MKRGAAGDLPAAPCCASQNRAIPLIPHEGSVKAGYRVPRYVILKTQDRQYHNVLRHQKHATNERPRSLGPGDVILVHRVGSGRTVPPSVTHAMDCVRVYVDTTGESQKIWGRSWRFIVQGEHLRQFPRPIPISRFGKASGKNYGQGAQKLVYVEEADVKDLQAAGLL